MTKDRALPPVSIVIPTLNEERYLPLLLDSLLRVDGPFEIIVADGKSDDDTAGVVAAYGNRYKDRFLFRFFQTNVRNISAQRNFGAAHAQHDVLLFLDADVIVPSGEHYERLVIEFLHRDLVAGNARLVAHPHENSVFQRMIFSLMRIFQHTMLRYDRVFFAGACIMVKKDAFRAVGGFDANIKLGEDVDLGRRMRAYGAVGFLSTPVSTSTRRMEKTSIKGYWAIAKALHGYIATGRVPESLAEHYPFGHY